jgi:uncharacterized membrane protein YfcA
MTAAEAMWLVVAGVGAGLSGSVAGLASLVSYPALLAAGLAPVSANVTNTVALMFGSVGSISASGPELVGQRRHLVRLTAAGVVGGAGGGALLLVTPGDAFEKAVPWLVAAGALAILARRRLVDVSIEEGHHHAHHEPTPRMLLAVGAVGVYGGYFGAGAGVMLLSLLLFLTGDTLPRANAAKNVVLGMANGVAALTFVLFGPVRWLYVLPLGAGLLLGGRAGPVVVRRAPQGPLRVFIGLAGLGLAVKLGIDAY